MSSVKGGRELRARLKAAGLMFKPYGRLWADTAAQEMRGDVPVDTGRLRKSLKRKNATRKRATVYGMYWANFVDAGSKAHDIKARKAPFLVFEAGGRTIFAKKVHKRAIAARPFKRKGVDAALRKHPMRETLTRMWNEAA